MIFQKLKDPGCGKGSTLLYLSLEPVFDCFPDSFNTCTKREPLVPGCLFSYFSPKFLFFPIFQQFFSPFILFFSQKLKETSEIRRISCSGKSHSCEIASLWPFPPK